MPLPPWGVMLLIIGFYLALGTFMEGFSMVITTIPVVFPVVLALGSGGIWAALGMVGVLILANSVLENLARPLTFGAVLRLHPLVVLLVTLAGGLLGGGLGMMIAPPVAAIAADVVRQVRAS